MFAWCQRDIQDTRLIERPLRPLGIVNNAGLELLTAVYGHRTIRVRMTVCTLTQIVHKYTCSS